MATIFKNINIEILLDSTTAKHKMQKKLEKLGEIEDNSWSTEFIVKSK